MSDNPFEKWQKGRPFGTFRQTDPIQAGLIPVPVVRDPGHRTYFANNFFAWSSPGGADGTLLEISFDYQTFRRDVVFRPSGTPAEPDNTDAKPPSPAANSGSVQQVIQELCVVTMPASLAAQLVKVLLERLKADAEQALVAAGLDFTVRPNE
jgi:hypothetical protein